MGRCRGVREAGEGKRREQAAGRQGTGAELEGVVAAAAEEVARGGGQRGVRVAGERAAALELTLGALDEPAAVAHRHAEVAAPQAHCRQRTGTHTHVAAPRSPRAPHVCSCARVRPHSHTPRPRQLTILFTVHPTPALSTCLLGLRVHSRGRGRPGLNRRYAYA